MDEVNGLWEDPDFEKALVLVGDILDYPNIDKFPIFDCAALLEKNVRILKREVPKADIIDLIPTMDMDDVIELINEIRDHKKANYLLQSAESIYVTAPVKVKPFLDMISSGTPSQEAHGKYIESLEE